MESRYVDAEAERAVEGRAAGVSELLALRTYTARLLGADPTLVLHGGGNTSVKAQAKDALGENVDVLHVKGSGWDLATIEPPGHPAVRLARLGKLLELPDMSDEQMVNELRLALLDASAPTPSVETLLHAALPARFIDHTHANAILAIADQPDAERICKEVFGDRLLFIPYVMPGFGLAKACKKAWDAAVAGGRSPTVMVLERHGVFTFGETAKESYERMIEVVTLAERFAADRMGTMSFPAVDRDEVLEAQVVPIVRGALAAVANEAPERGPIVALRSSEWILAFLERTDAYELTQRGCVTPDHVIRTKPWPLFSSGRDAETIERDIRDYALRYDRYFEETCRKRGVKKTKLDPWPRVVLMPKVGILAVGKTKKEAEIAADIFEHAIHVITDAEDVGTFSPVSREDLFDVEYWSLEQAKIKKQAELPLGKRVALVTGAASGIGKATAEKLVALGAHVVAFDRSEPTLEERAELVTVKGDVTSADDVARAVRCAARTFGGLDILVSNAGGASEGRLDSEEGDEALRKSLELNLLSHNLVASAAADVMRRQARGGAILFNASKSAFNQGPGFGPYSVPKAALVALMRQYAVDLGRFGIRANAVNADRIRTGIFSGGVLESRAAARGISVDEYIRSNIL